LSGLRDGETGRIIHIMNTAAPASATNTLSDTEHRPLQGLLYHYTSIDAFLSIVEQKKLRATSLNYLNDESEGELGISLIRDAALQEQQQASGRGKEFLELLVSWLDKDYLRELGAVYALCFSERRDQLSQWRGYTPHGRGICLGIDIGVLVQRMQQIGTGWTFQNCRYQKPSQKTWARAILSRLMREATEEPSSNPRSQHFQEVINRNMPDVVRVAALMKNESFVDEMEVRFISPMFRHDDPKVKFRPGRSTIVPYIEFDLVERPEDRLPSIDVLIGPGPSQRLTHAAATYVMQRHQLSVAVNYCSSSIPYREL
jgi:hypothetical protein